MSETLAVIPARGGSKGIPRKNLREIDGKPLIAHQIKNAVNASLVDRTIVSTEDDEIAEVATEYGAEVPFKRPDDLARDDVPVIAVFKHAMRWFRQQGVNLESIVGLQPTCPFTTSSDIDDSIEKIRTTGCDSVVSVSKVTETHPYRSYRLIEDQLEPFGDVTVHEPMQRQERPVVYGLTGAIFVRDTSVLREWEYDDFALGEDVRAIIQPKERALDIDTPFDLRMARALCNYEEQCQ